MVYLPISLFMALMLETSLDVFGELHNVMVRLPGSRANEREADMLGMHLAARACFQPHGMLTMLQVRHTCSGS